MTDLTFDARADTARMIADSAKFLTSSEHIARARRLRWTKPGFERELWSRAAELGWLGLRVPEDRGGVGLGVREFCVLCEVLGSGLVPEPLVESIALAPLLDDASVGDALRGSRIVLPAWQETHDKARSTTSFVSGRLCGHKHHVRMGQGADLFAVSVEHGLVLVEAYADGVTVTEAPLQDGGHFASLTFDGAQGKLIFASIQEMVEEITLATASYLLGVMRSALQTTRDYIITRSQFGQAIGSFQVVQHRMADLYMQVELAGASIRHAAELIDGGLERAVRRRAVSRAKARASEAAMLVTKQGVQLHGGMGFADEADIGLFLRKALTLANLYGSPEYHRERYTASLDLGAQGMAA